jgi:NAD(P)H-hydrate epimerase
MPEMSKVLTAAEMREVDRRTSELGIPSLILMENAAHRVVEFLVERFGPLEQHRVVVFCGKGNNGGDGLAVARQLHTRFHLKSLDVLLACLPQELSGDAAANYRMLEVGGGKCRFEIEPRMQAATLIVDALLGTGLTGPARGTALDWIRAINDGFSGARVVCVDIPSGMSSDTGEASGEFVRADATVTFTAPHYCHVLAPNCNKVGELRVSPIGSPASLYEDARLSLIEPSLFRCLLAPRDPNGNKGLYGHVLIVAGSRGKTGAAAMAGMAALHAGAGLVTVASVASAIPVIAGYAPELMTAPLEEGPDGSASTGALGELHDLAKTRSLMAMGPGLGTSDGAATIVREFFAGLEKPIVADADALNILATGDWPDAHGNLRVLTPHPGEMARLTGSTVPEVQGSRLECARKFAARRNVILVLKGERTLVAFPDGEVWVNPTGSPAMATGGTGDVLTGMISGMLAQFPKHPREAVAAAVWLHGRAGELGAVRIGEQAFVATDLLRLLPEAIRDARD